MKAGNGKPSIELLQKGAPLHIWAHAEQQAEQSPHKRHRTGAVIYYGMGMGSDANVFARGYAHPMHGIATWSMHAESHAIQHLPMGGPYYYGGAVICIVTLTKNGNYASTSRPCEDCTRNLMSHVWGVVYAERTNDGGWAMVRRTPEELSREFLAPTKMANRHE